MPLTPEGHQHVHKIGALTQEGHHHDRIFGALTREGHEKLIRMEHLNHHGNLYAGQAIEWMVETSFIVVNCEYGDPQGLLYKNTHKFDFYKSVNPGDIVYYEGLIVRTG